jgi:RluA family pseudouridine synthase
MPKPKQIELETGDTFPILYEDRSVLAIDKPAGWMLVPYSWQDTDRNLQAAITSSVAAGDFWARSRNLKFLRNVHRLDAGTTGILLMAKSPGALNTYGDLFETRQMKKSYLAVVEGVPARKEWDCDLPLEKDEKQIGRMKVDPKNGKDAQTYFRLLESRDGRSLVEAQPITGRTHQIRVHLAAAGHAVLGDSLYGKGSTRKQDKESPALRSVSLEYLDPFQRRKVRIEAPTGPFLEEFGFR